VATNGLCTKPFSTDSTAGSLEVGDVHDFDPLPSAPAIGTVSMRPVTDPVRLCGGSTRLQMQRANAACASSVARVETRSCSPATAVQRVLASTLSREKKQLNHFCGLRAVLRRHRRQNLAVQVLPELGYIQVGGDRHTRRSSHADSHRPGGRRTGCRSGAFTVNDRHLLGVSGDVAEPALSVASGDLGDGRGSVHVAHARVARLSEQHRRGQTFDLRRSDELYRVCSAYGPTCSTPVYLRQRNRRMWVGIPALLLPATTATPKSPPARLADWGPGST